MEKLAEGLPIKKLAIVIPAIDFRPDSAQLLNNLLTSIERGGIDEIAEVVVCYDGCQERFVHEISEKYKFTIPLPNYSNRGNFAINSNRGLRFAHKELKLPVLLCNMDCELPNYRGIEHLIEPEAIVSPRAVNEWGSKTYLIGKTETTNKFAYFCPFISTEVLDEIGYIDEGFITFTDDDHITRALLAGFKCYLSSIEVLHKGSYIDQAAQGGSMCGSYNMERLGIDHQKYVWKWSIPPEVTHENYNAWILSAHKWQKEMYVA